MSPLSFRNAHVVFATKHGKAEAARESFGTILNATIEQCEIDSDQLGTFSGEIERPGSMLDALRGKVLLARQKTHERFVLVSEGSFGGADGFGFVTRGIEMLMLHDQENGVEILEQHISLATNYSTSVISTWQDLERFLDRMSFPNHALLLYPKGALLPSTVCKGLRTKDEVRDAFERSLKMSDSGQIIAMSDMRAHLNPSRMRAIAECCRLLAQRLDTVCPRCQSGGFGLVETVPGLPCDSCGSATCRARAELHSCALCKHSVEKPREDGRRSVPAAECEYCNP